MSHYLCGIAEVGEHGKEIRVPSGSGMSGIMLFQHDGAIRAFLNVCPHQGSPLNCGPDQFLFSREKWLVCAHHGASFDLETGKCQEGPCRGASLRAVNIRVSEGSVWLDQPLESLVTASGKEGLPSPG